MHWTSFLVGASVGAVALALTVLANPLLAVNIYNALYRRWFRQRTRPKKLSSLSAVQPFVKDLLAAENEQGLFVCSEEPPFAIRVWRKTYKTRSDVLILEIRNTEENRTSFGAACAALEGQGPDFKQTLTPKTKRPSRAEIRVEANNLGVAAIVSAMRSVFESVGASPGQPYLVGNNDPLLWSQL